MYEKIVKLNPDLKIVKLSQKSVLYNAVDYDSDSILALSKGITVQDDNVYIANDERAQNTEFCSLVQKNVFAELPIQAGWNYGRNDKMNGMEWHKSSEVIVACSDMVLLLGSFFDVVEDTFDSKKAFGLYLQKGQSVELLPMTLHLAPLPVCDDGFVSAVLLPEGTNLPLAMGIQGAKRARNKWLLVHKDNVKGVLNGGLIGIVGDNIILHK